MFESDTCLVDAPASSISVQEGVDISYWICWRHWKSYTAFSFPHLVHMVVGLLNTLGKKKSNRERKPIWERDQESVTGKKEKIQTFFFLKYDLLFKLYSFAF